MPDDFDDLPLFSAGRAKRDEVLGKLARRRQYDALVKYAALVARSNGTVTANDIRPHLRDIGYTGDSRIVGAVLRNKVFEPIGVTQTSNPQAHARPIRRFKLREAE